MDGGRPTLTAWVDLFGQAKRRSRLRRRWARNGDLPRPLQQMLFDAADSLTPAASSQPAELAS
jgi:hypothetical protein